MNGSLFFAFSKNSAIFVLEVWRWSVVAVAGGQGMTFFDMVSDRELGLMDLFDEIPDGDAGEVGCGGGVPFGIRQEVLVEHIRTHPLPQYNYILCQGKCRVRYGSLVYYPIPIQLACIRYSQFYAASQQKNQQRTMKVEENKHRTQIISYHSRKFKVSEPEIGSIAIEFYDSDQQRRYAVNKHLEHVSFKTVVSALRQSEPQIISLALLPLGPKQYEMRVRVKLEYLHEMEEALLFEAQPMSEEDARQLRQLGQLQKKLAEVREEVNQLTRLHCLKGTIQNRPPNVQEIIVDVPYNSSLFTIFLDFKHMTSNVVKTTLTYFDTLTKKRLPVNILPDQMFVYDNAQLQAIACRSSFDKAVFSVQGDFTEVQYIIACEQVEKSQAVDYAPVAKAAIRILLLGLCFWGLRSAWRWMFPTENASCPEL